MVGYTVPLTRVPRESRFQASFAVLHFYAAVLAAFAVALHLSASVYHTRRWREASRCDREGAPLEVPPARHVPPPLRLARRA